MEKFVCPSCKKPLKIDSKNNKLLICYCQECKLFKYEFPIINNIPNLIPFGLDLCIFSKREDKIDFNYGFDARKSNLSKEKIKKFILRFFKGENNITKKNFLFLEKNLKSGSRVLVIGGGNLGNGMYSFYKKCQAKNIIYHSIDVYFSERITLLADAHYLPFEDKKFDFVIIQAVLEHVISPEVVVSEIYRVLSLNGIVYAETPFLQAVHEGPFDYKRFTHSGHRWLFKDFEEIKSGAHQGAFSSVLFNLSYALSGIFRSQYIGKIFRLIFNRLFKLLDSLTGDKWNIDIACGCYFLGRKSISKVSYKDKNWIEKYYKGSQQK